MLSLEARRCRACGYPVTAFDAFDDYGPGEGFVATMLEGRLKGLRAATDVCPKCSAELTLESTELEAQGGEK
jgi:hypothetical protein